MFIVWTLCGRLSLYGGQRGSRGRRGLCLYIVDVMKEERLVVCIFCYSVGVWWWCLLVYIGARVFMWWTLFVLSL